MAKKSQIIYNKDVILIVESLESHLKHSYQVSNTPEQ